MAYEKRISRTSPGYIVLDLDDSGSQKESLPGTADPKWMWVERLAGCLLKELLARSTEPCDRGDSADRKEPAQTVKRGAQQSVATVS